MGIGDWAQSPIPKFNLYLFLNNQINKILNYLTIYNYKKINYIKQINNDNNSREI